MPDTLRTSYHSPGTSGFACADRMAVRFRCRVTTALRFVVTRQASDLTGNMEPIVIAKLPAWSTDAMAIQRAIADRVPQCLSLR